MTKITWTFTIGKLIISAKSAKRTTAKRLATRRHLICLSLKYIGISRTYAGTMLKNISSVSIPSANCWYLKMECSWVLTWQQSMVRGCRHKLLLETTRTQKKIKNSIWWMLRISMARVNPMSWKVTSPSRSQS
jgi:hypothetical protein